jgi:hypothetical protein
MDDDAALRSLAAELEREDPHLAALLSEARPRRRAGRRVWWLLLALALLSGLMMLPLTTALGVLVLVLAMAAPLAGYLAGTRPDEGPSADG